MLKTPTTTPEERAKIVGDLETAKAMLADPVNWGKGSFKKLASIEEAFQPFAERTYCYCAIGAVREIDGALLNQITAIPFLVAALPTMEDRADEEPDFDWGLVADYNDAETTTHEDILDLFDRAISLVKNPDLTAPQLAWIKALRKGGYPQGRMQLGNTTWGFCCLGVLCHVAVEQGVIEGFHRGDLFPSTAVAEWASTPSSREFSEVEPWYSNVVDVDGRLVPFSMLNDHFGYTFAEIADIIEEGGVHQQIPGPLAAEVVGA